MDEDKLHDHGDELAEQANQAASPEHLQPTVPDQHPTAAVGKHERYPAT